MKRILSVMALAAAVTLASGTVALAKRQATKSGSVPAQLAAAARCAEPSRCPFGSCPLGSKSATATVASTPAPANGAACSDPARCSTACRPANTGAMAAVVAKP